MARVEEQGAYFPSEKSWLLGLLLWGPVLGLPYVAFRGGPWLPVLIGLSMYILMVSWLWFTTGYRVTETRLYVKCGPLDFDVPLSSIRCVRSTWSPLASAALSLRRLAITLDSGERLMVSPKDRERFISLLRERCPQACFKV